MAVYVGGNQGGLFDLRGVGRIRPRFLTGHTNSINLMHFVAQGRVLVTADKDNRVIFWPRHAEGFGDER